MATSYAIVVHLTGENEGDDEVLSFDDGVKWVVDEDGYLSVLACDDAKVATVQMFRVKYVERKEKSS